MTIQRPSTARLILKGVVGGGMVGISGFLIAPMGLGVGCIEFLRPLLIPGVDLIMNRYFHPLSGVQR